MTQFTTKQDAGQLDKPIRTSFQVSSHVIGRVKHLQTMEELNETGVETTYQMHSSSLALGTNSDSS